MLGEISQDLPAWKIGPFLHKAQEADKPFSNIHFFSVKFTATRRENSLALSECVSRAEDRTFGCSLLCRINQYSQGRPLCLPLRQNFWGGPVDSIYFGKSVVVYRPRLISHSPIHVVHDVKNPVGELFPPCSASNTCSILS